MKPLSFWAYVREREAIRIKRERGEPPPWTNDQVLRAHSFTNVRRIDDPDTLRSLELVADGAKTPHEFVWRTYALRCLNRAETFEKYGLPFPRSFARWRDRLDAAQARGEPIGAGQHLTFWSHAKLALERLTPDVSRRVHASTSGIDAINVLAEHRPTLYVGPYLGTLIVGDLALSPKFGGAFGSATRVPVANGARVGLEIVHGMPPVDAHELFNERGARSRRARSIREGARADIVARVDRLVEAAEAKTGMRLTFMDIENSLCEYSRYARIAAGLGGHWRGRIRRK